MTKIESTIIILLTAILLLSGYQTVNATGTTVKDKLASEFVTASARVVNPGLEVKPATNYEDKLQQSADNRAVRLQYGNDTNQLPYVITGQF